MGILKITKKAVLASTFTKIKPIRENSREGNFMGREN